MVSLPLLIALLTLIDVTRSFEYFIDLERCKTQEMACYVRDSCLELPTPGDSTALKKITIEKLKGDTCDVIVQIRSFSLNKYLIMMQVNVSASESPSDELDINAGVSFVQKDTLIKCNANGVEGQIMFGGQKGTRQIISKSYIFCAAILFSEREQIFMALNKVPYDATAPTLEFVIKNKPEKEVVETGSTGMTFWLQIKVTCDDQYIKTENTTLDDYLLTEIDSLPTVFSCPEPQQIRMIHEQKLVMANSFYCDLKQIQWTFKINEIVVVFPKATPIEVFCSIKFSEICSHSAPLQYNECTGCSRPTPIGNDTLTCPENKWRMSDGSVMRTEVKCKRKGNERTSTWQMNDGTEITEGACSKNFDCATFNKLNFTIPKGDNVYEYKPVNLLEDGNRIHCTEGNLTISPDGDNKKTTIIEENLLVCNTEDGNFQPEDKPNMQIKNRSSVYCAVKHGRVNPDDKPKDVQPATGAMNPTTIAAGVGGAIIVIIIIGGAIAAIIVYRRTKRIQDEKDMEYKRLNTFSTCREIDPYKEILRQNGKKWVLDEIPEQERLMRDKLMNKMLHHEPLKYNDDGQQKAVDNDLIPRKGEFDYWTKMEFLGFIYDRFHRFTPDYRIKGLRALTCFISFSEEDTWKGKVNKDFGTIDQFFELLKMCHVHKVKDWQVWDHFFRLSLRFYESCSDSPILNPRRRFRDLWKEIAKSMLDDLGIKPLAKENYQMTGIRQVALRVMLWLKDKDWTRIIAEEAKKLPKAIAEEIRPVILQYAVREGGREEEIKKEFYDEIKRQEWEIWTGVRNGIYRHHLIYALCSAKDKPDEEGNMRNLYTTRREIIEAIYKNQKDLNRIFTPKDIYYAFKGATEEPEAAVYAVDMYSSNECNFTAKDYDNWIDVVIRRTDGLENRRERMLDRFKSELVATMQLVGESCASEGLFKELKNAWRGCVEYAVPPGSDVFNEELLEERTRNVRFICDYKKLDRLLVTAMERSGFRVAPVDGGGG